MFKKKILGFISLLIANTLFSNKVLKKYHEASTIITNQILNNEDLLYFSKDFYIEDVTCFFENIILAAYALTCKDKILLNTTLNNFEPLLDNPFLLKECLDSFYLLFNHKKYTKHLSLTAIHNHLKEITIFICLCKKLSTSAMFYFFENTTAIIENYKNDIGISKILNSESEYNEKLQTSSDTSLTSD